MGRRTFASDEAREFHELDMLDDHETRLDAIGPVPPAGLVGDVAQVDVGDAAAAGASGRYADAAHQHALPVPGTPAASAVGDVAATGASAKVAREDHRHAREAFGVPGSSAIGDAVSNGVATTLARSDHRHGREAAGTPGASAVGDTASAGAAATVARSDHRHSREAFGATTTVTQTSAATSGAAATPARSDHDHGWPAAAPRGVVGADATITANSTAVTAETLVTGLTKSVTVGTSRRLRIEVTCRVNSTVAGDLIRLRIRNGLTTAGVQLEQGQARVDAVGGAGQETVTFFHKGTFTGAQDFCVTIERGAGTGNVLVAAEATSPAILSVVDEGG